MDTKNNIANENVKKLRLDLQLSQKEFGEKLGVTGTAVSRIESGERALTDQMLFSICLTFDVNKEWLRTGKGNMFISHTSDEELAMYMGKLLGEENPLKEKYALLALKLIVDEWNFVENSIEKIKLITDWIESRPTESQMP